MNARSFGLGALIVLVALARGAPGAAPPAFDVPRLAEVVIDGRAADWGEAGFRVETMTGPYGGVRPPGDADGRFRLAWDDRGLLVLLHVRDDRFIEHEAKDELWRADAVELYLATRRGERDLFQAVISPGLAEGQPELRFKVYNHAKAKALKQKTMTIEAARAKTDHGYRLEARLPWSNLEIDPKVGREVGFQLFIDDRDKGEDQFHLAWYPRVGTFANSKAMHRVRLSEQASDPQRVVMRISIVGHAPLTATVIGPAGLTGERAELIGADGVFAGGRMRPWKGRSLAIIDLDDPLPEGGAGRRAVRIAGETVGMNFEPITAPPAWTAAQRRAGRRLRRTMSRLAHSSPSHRMPVHVLFYGQSIVESPWWRRVKAALERRYPYADLTIENKAIGGWEAHRLIHAAEQDLYPAYPDLVVFHVYAGEFSGQVERIISKLRRRTTAGVLLFTHHGPKGGGFDRGAEQWRLLAQRYGCELADVRQTFKRYIEAHDLGWADVLRDGVHPNALGNKLIAATVMRHLKLDRGGTGWSGRVRVRHVLGEADDERVEAMRYTGEPWRAIPPAHGRAMPAMAVGESADSALELTFKGNRVDVVVGDYEGEAGTATVLIDGKAPSEHPGVYMVGRVDPPPGSGWPTLARVEHERPLLAERWTLRIVELKDRGKHVAFEVIGSETGPDGRGTNGERFVSDSGRVVIEPEWWALAGAVRFTGAKPTVGTEVHWEVTRHAVDIYDPGGALAATRAKAKRYAEAIRPGDRRQAGRAGRGWVTRRTLAEGLGAGEHTLTINPHGDGPVPIQSIVVHRPPLR